MAKLRRVASLSGALEKIGAWKLESGGELARSTPGWPVPAFRPLAPRNQREPFPVRTATRKEIRRMHSSMDILWLVLVVAGPIVLGAVLAYALLTRRRLRDSERNAQRAATERLYREQSPGPRT